MWEALIAADVARRLTASEMNAVKTAAKDSGQSGDTILSEAIADVTTQVRGYVAGCARNTLGEEGTIPTELKAAALALVRDYLFTRLPGMKSLNDELRQKETDRAVQQLRDVSACRMAIVPPTTAADDQASGPAVESVGRRQRLATRRKLRGFL